MKLWMKLAGTALLAGTAAVCAAAAPVRFCMSTTPPASTTAAADFAYVPSCSLAEAEYVLREYDGCVAVFASAVDKDPITLTDIEIETLRDADRQILNAGLAVADREELLTLLEDLGT